MAYMFMNSKYQGDLSKWDTSSVENMTEIFYRCPFQGNIAAWDLSSLQECHAPFWLWDFNDSPLGWIGIWENTVALEEGHPWREKVAEIKQVMGSLDLGMVEAGQHLYQMFQHPEPLLASWMEFSATEGERLEF